MERIDGLPERCPRCSKEFTCGRGATQPCWCARLPPLPLSRLAAGADCLCPACLAILCADGAASFAEQR